MVWSTFFDPDSPIFRKNSREEGDTCNSKALRFTSSYLQANAKSKFSHHLSKVVMVVKSKEYQGRKKFLNVFLLYLHCFYHLHFGHDPFFKCSLVNGYTHYKGNSHVLERTY